MRRGRLLAVLLLVALAAPVAAEPLLHEYVTPDVDDGELAPSAATGSAVRVIETPSGRMDAPDPRRSVWDPTTRPYGPESQSASHEPPVFRLDADTTRPDVLQYHDPFSPSVTPFKRQFAFDVVEPELHLGLSAAAVLPLTIGGEVRANEDQFFADLVVDLAVDTPVRIPSAGPGARVLSAQLGSDGRFGLYRDAADNWFITAARSGRARLVMRQAVPREAMSPDFADVDWSELPRPRALPEAAAAAAERVLTRLGLDRSARPASLVRKLVAHFRAFEPSSELPVASTETALYEELALSKKGVCRHRAFAFVVTALQLGIPTRFVHNEAHAWVEVNDSRFWRRIDLGGAVGRLESAELNNAAPYRQPPDPFGWPPTAHSGAGLAAPTVPSGVTTPQPVPSTSTTGSSEVERAGETTTDERPTTQLEVEPVKVRSLGRGERLELRGKANAKGVTCGSQRVDVLAFGATGAVPLGVLATAEDGTFAASITVRLDLPVGDYDVQLRAQGNTRCAPSAGSGSRDEPAPRRRNSTPARR